MWPCSPAFTRAAVTRSAAPTAFFDAQGLHDVQVLSTAGLSNGDIAALRKVNGVAKVQAERSQEVTFDLDGRKSATMQEIGTNGIDQPYLQEGRMPKKAGEIAVTRKFIRDSGKRIGSRLTVIPESASSDTSDTNDTNGADGTNETNGTDEAPSFPTKLTIVGVVLDPQNLSNPDGYSAMTSFRSTATTDYTFFAPSDGVTGTSTRPPRCSSRARPPKARSTNRTKTPSSR